jgi:hypothetical protein
MGKINGNKELAKAIKKLNIDLVKLVAETSIWVSPLMCEQVKNKKGSVARFPNVRRGKNDETKGDVINGIRIDDNTYANNAIKWAVGIDRKNITDYETCHIWTDTCYNERYHTALPNLVLIPRAIASLSDHSEEIINALKYRSYELYGWYPDEEIQPGEPQNYPTNWKEPVMDGNLKIEKSLLEEQERKVLIEAENDNYKDKVAKEIDKINSKVPKWFLNPKQINSTILINFMNLLSQSKTRYVSKKSLEQLCSSVKDFAGNFNQMVYFGKNNHGKVFEKDGDDVRLWEAIEKLIWDEWNKYPELH